MLQVITKFSLKRFYELRIYPFSSESSLFSKALEALESAFISWSNRVPHRSLSLIIVHILNEFRVEKEILEVIEKFKRLGVIEKFEFVKDQLVYPDTFDF